jgi:pimeloyl-ACP methyl ester carboxylesterase
MASDQPTIVLVHGAWADATGFGEVIRALHRDGYTAVGVANPLRELASDAAYLTDLLGSISGPMVLVGHSYGGAVISNAATDNDQVTALVYLNGWMPDEDESMQQLIEKAEDSEVPPALRPVEHSGGDVDLYLDQDAFPATFAGDVEPDTAGVMAATQRPWGQAALGTPSGPPAWKSIPSWYLLGTEDKVIPADRQRFMAQRAGARIVEVKAGHLAMITRPGTATDLIVKAVHRTTSTA